MNKPVSPSLAVLTEKIATSGYDDNPSCNLFPIHCRISSDTLTPVCAFLRLGGGTQGTSGFLLESLRGEIGQGHSFLSTSIYSTLTPEGDPIDSIQSSLAQFRYAVDPDLPLFTGGAVGYISYDSIGHFEPSLSHLLEMPKSLDIPEAAIMLVDSAVIFDHKALEIILVSHVYAYEGMSSMALAHAYNQAVAKLTEMEYKLTCAYKEPAYNKTSSPQPTNGKSRTVAPFPQEDEAHSREKYMAYVTSLKKNIVEGQIIQAVPSRRIAKPTSTPPFDIYRTLRRVNPSPYLFYLDFIEAQTTNPMQPGSGSSASGSSSFQVIGASPETLCKVSRGGYVENHAIAGTVKRGQTSDEDIQLGKQLLESPKDRAEHIMLVDLARNDVNRVCKPESVIVKELMKVQYFSHVIHLTSLVIGKLQEGLTRFDAFKSIFPAGTVSGAPKIRAIQLISRLEKQKRGIYAGAVGWWSYDGESMDTCIAIRTMTVKDGVAYLQAGGGIVFDSNEEEEYQETVNKLNGNLRCVELAEEEYLAKCNAAANKPHIASNRSSLSSNHRRSSEAGPQVPTLRSSSLSHGQRT